MLSTLRLLGQGRELSLGSLALLPEVGEAAVPPRYASFSPILLMETVSWSRISCESEVGVSLSVGGSLQIARSSQL